MLNFGIFLILPPFGSWIYPFIYAFIERLIKLTSVVIVLGRIDQLSVEVVMFSDSPSFRLFIQLKIVDNLLKFLPFLLLLTELCIQALDLIQHLIQTLFHFTFFFWAHLQLSLQVIIFNLQLFDLVLRLVKFRYVFYVFILFWPYL